MTLRSRTSYHARIKHNGVGVVTSAFTGFGQEFSGDQDNMQRGVFCFQWERRSEGERPLAVKEQALFGLNGLQANKEYLTKGGGNIFDGEDDEAADPKEDLVRER